MARCATMVAVLLVAMLAVVPQQTSGLGKGKALLVPALGKGKGSIPDVNVDVQCTDVCSDVCTNVPTKVCSDVQVPVQKCQKVPVQQTKQMCQRVCTKTYTEPIHGKGKGMVVPVSYGKGRRLMGLISSLLGKGAVVHSGKGQQLVDTNCTDMCQDVPYTTFTTACSTETTTRTTCSIQYSQQCQKVCKPVCQKVTTVTTTTPVHSGKGMVVPMGKGFGKR